MSDNTVEFSDLPLEDRIRLVDERIGDHPDRIKHPYDLLDLYGETIYLVVSPFGKDQEIGNCFLLTWEVGKVMEHRGAPVSKDVPLTFDDDEKYVCQGLSKTTNGISLKDFNIVPNSYNNHAAFTNAEAADAYAMFRKLQFMEDPSIAELEGDYAHWFTEEDIERLRKSEENNK